MHLPNLVQCLAMICLTGASLGGYVMDALVRMSIRFGNLPIIVYESSNVWIHRVVSGYHHRSFNLLFSFNC